MTDKKKTARETRLTEREKEFAAQNHNLIYTLMRQYHIPIEEYYGEAAHGYLLAVRKYHRQPKLRLCRFSVIAAQSIRCYCYNEMDSRKRYAGHIKYSLNEVIDAEGNERGDFQRDHRDPFRELEDQEEMKRPCREIRQSLSGNQQEQFSYLLKGYKPKEIRQKLKKGLAAYKEDMEYIKRTVLLSCTGATE